MIDTSHLVKLQRVDFIFNLVMNGWCHKNTNMTTTYLLYLVFSLAQLLLVLFIISKFGPFFPSTAC